MTVIDDGGLPGPVAMLPGSVLLDPDWLAEAVAATGAFYDCTQPRVNATLWWYSAGAVLLGRSVHELVLLGRGCSLDPAGLRILPGPAGLQRVVPGPPLPPGASSFGAHLDQAVGPVIEALTRAAPVSARSLWAVTADTLATRLLAEVRAGEPEPPAAAVAAGSRLLRPSPRFVRVVRDRDRPELVTQVRRVSCCLLRRVPAGVCVSCPAQEPAERTRRLEALVSGVTRP